MKQACFAQTYCCFIGACLSIVSLSATLKDQTQGCCFQRSLEISYSERQP